MWVVPLRVGELCPSGDKYPLLLWVRAPLRVGERLPSVDTNVIHWTLRCQLDLLDMKGQSRKGGMQRQGWLDHKCAAAVCECDAAELVSSDAPAMPDIC